MRILVDENIPRITVAALRGFGHDVKDIRGTMEEGMLDPELWQLVLRDRRMFITTDKAFAQRRDEPHFGLLVVLLSQPNADILHARIMESFQAYNEVDWPALLVMCRDHMVTTWRAQSSE